MESGAVPTQEFQSVKSTLQALEEIESGNVVVHPDPEAKREALRRRIEAERIRKEEEERKIKEQIAKEKEDGEKIAISEGIQDENEIVKDRAEKLLSEKLENATDGEVYLDNEDMQVIIDAAQNREAVTTNTSSEVGKNFDFKI